MRRTDARMSDGRAILYYDRGQGPAPSARDLRDLPPRTSVSELRWDPTVEEWVVVAGHRQGRTFLPPTDECPLCPSAPGRPSEVAAGSYEVVVFENRFSSLSDAAADLLPDVLEGLVPRRPGHGRCEVVCFTPDHDASFAALTPDAVRLVVDVWADRTASLGALPGVEQVFPFENRGVEIGVTLAHPHGQVYAYPFVTPRTRRTLAAAARHRKRTGRALYDDVVAAELASDRVVAADEHWVAFVPAAARWPFEVHLHPRVRVPDLPALGEAARDAFGPLYLDVLRRLDGVFGVRMPYVAAWHQAPVREGRDDAALHLQLFSSRRTPTRLKYLAGSESAMDVFVNDVSPEEAARLLRAAAPVVLPA
ncbi:MAG: galactose-phosphate uridylyltransferase [Frankiales bacterium]|nr:galactose-phosphate uridylyltransferase [Frankiales bacterium]